MMAARRRDRRLWAGVAVITGGFAAYKAFEGQAIIVGQVERFARNGGWYAARHAPQWAGDAMVVLLVCAAAAIVLRRTARRSGPARTAVALATVLVAYALLGMISLHAWDRLVSRRVGGVELFTLIELALPLTIALCALAARPRGRRARAR